ncbi:hypothetical protein C8Q70DRAFT_927104 [Cubamyces menziesii]|nr:hypothetical protein C8Q70DRAFT_927104 [Cubamyces menziesii]
MHVVSDSKYVVNGLTKWLHRWEQIGWIGVQNAGIIKRVVAYLRSRSAPTTFRWVKGHTDVEGNEGADELAAAGAELERPYMPMALPPPTEYLRNGTELADLTQKLAYAGIRRVKDRKTEKRKKTAGMISQALEAVQQYDGNKNTKVALWKAIRRSEIDKRVRDFIWKMAHGAHRVGTFWSNIPGYENRAVCVKCGTMEDMDHILTKCSAAGQERLWWATRMLLARRGIRLPENMSAALVVGSPLGEVKGDDGAVKAGDTRLLRIAISETAYLIWKMRCERVIEWEDEEGREHAVQEIDGRWQAMYNARIALDQAMTSVRLAGKRAIAGTRVSATWKGILSNEQELPPDWAERQVRVLVGRPRMEPNG